MLYTCMWRCFLLSELDETTDQQVLAAATNRESAWVTLETSRESRHWLPWRPNCDVGESSVEDCEDPDRVVVFDDLSGALFSIEPTEDRFYLLCVFLDFIGKFLPSSSVEKPDFSFTEEHSTVYSLWWKVREAFPDVDSLSAFDEVQLADSQLEKLCTFVDNVCVQTIGLFEGDFRTALTLRYVHFKMASILSQNNLTDRRKRKHAEKQLRQFFKSLLKQEQNRGNLAVWERYACFEWEIGNYDDARKVFETALAMAGLATNEVHESGKVLVVHLYSTYSRLELGTEIQSPTTFGTAKKETTSDSNQTLRTKRALRILTMAVNGYNANSVGADVAPPDIVRARHFYQRRLDDIRSGFAASDTERIKFCSQSLLVWTSCFAMFQLLTVGLPAATSILQNFRTRLRSLPMLSTEVADANSEKPKVSGDHRSMSENPDISACRSLLQSAARLHVQLAKFCLNSAAAPLNVVRTALSDALSEFPDDVWFLKILIDVELSSHISGRLQEYFHRAVTEASTPLPVLYAILAGRKRLLRLSTDAQAPCM